MMCKCAFQLTRAYLCYSLSLSLLTCKICGVTLKNTLSYFASGVFWARVNISRNAWQHEALLTIIAGLLSLHAFEYLWVESCWCSCETGAAEAHTAHAWVAINYACDLEQVLIKKILPFLVAKSYSRFYSNLLSWYLKRSSTNIQVQPLYIRNRESSQAHFL